MKKQFINLFILVFVTNLAMLQSCKKEEVLLTSIVDDRDGQKYRVIKIGDQYWFAENLNYDTVNSVYYNNDKVFGDLYGRLYTREVTFTVCPKGWHLPTDDEWLTLEKTIGIDENFIKVFGERGTEEGYKLKTVDGWSGQNLGTDDYGFSALPAGMYWHDGNFRHEGRATMWWASRGTDLDGLINRSLFSNNGKIGRNKASSTQKLSIRCTRD